jgi:hypothetical protein
MWPTGHFLVSYNKSIPPIGITYGTTTGSDHAASSEHAEENNDTAHEQYDEDNDDAAQEAYDQDMVMLRRSRTINRIKMAPNTVTVAMTMLAHGRGQSPLSAHSPPTVHPRYTHGTPTVHPLAVCKVEKGIPFELCAGHR